MLDDPGAIKRPSRLPGRLLSFVNFSPRFPFWFPHHTLSPRVPPPEGRQKNGWLFFEGNGVICPQILGKMRWKDQCFWGKNNMQKTTKCSQFVGFWRFFEVYQLFWRKTFSPYYWWTTKNLTSRLWYIETRFANIGDFGRALNFMANQSTARATYPPPEIRPYDQGLLTIGFP